MAGQVLLHISKDERERARLTSEYKYAVDIQSKEVDAKREGVLEGAKNKAMEIVRNTFLMNMPTEDIVKLTGLTVDEVDYLRDVK